VKIPNLKKFTYRNQTGFSSRQQRGEKLRRPERSSCSQRLGDDFPTKGAVDEKD
jgi:hypothetical protein